ncbi:MAG: D-glycero-alpha-D-manno-heptose-1,7-bisphosphate 7-phosphatase [Nitrosotalea sp.]
MEILTKAVFLDRDGVINKEREGYITKIEDFELLPKVGELLNKMQQLGYALIIITNQSAINRGLLTHEELKQIHESMVNQLSKFGITIKSIYYCPHRPDENCDCRKPKTKLFSKAIEELGIDVNKSWFIGDKKTDLEAGEQIGLKTIQIPKNGSLESAYNYIMQQT